VGGAGTEPAAGGGRQNEGADIESGEDGGDDGAGQHDVHRRRGRLDRIWRGRRRHGSAGIAVLQCVGGRLEGAVSEEIKCRQAAPLLLRGRFVEDRGAHLHGACRGGCSVGRGGRGP
jgi:hypothetical protein